MRKKRYSRSTKNSTTETLEQQRANYPKKLIDAFVRLHNSGYADKEYKKYETLAQKYLGKKYDEILERLRLVVQFTSITYDLVEKD